VERRNRLELGTGTGRIGVEALRNFLAVGNGKRAGEDAGNREKAQSCITGPTVG
jgi:hypothetical protein